MDKVKLEYKTPEKKIIKYKNVDVEIIPILTISQKVFLIQKYIEDYFGTPDEILIENTKYHSLEAEIRLKYFVIQLITNIDTNNLDNESYVDNILWYIITNEIINWSDFRATLETIVCDIKQQETLETSIGKIISDLVQKGYALLEKLSDINPEEVKKAGEKGLQLMDRLEKTSVLKNPSDIAAILENPVDVSVKKVITEKKRKPRTKKV
jgi:hypothetical protein